MSGEEAVFDDFCHARRKFACRQGFKELGVDVNGFGLPKGTDEVLTFGKVDAGLPAD